MALAFIAVGSNVAPEPSIVAALRMLKERVAVRGSSRFYRTEPIGGRDQPPFVNGVWRVASNLPPAHIRHEILTPIEDRLGRIRTADKYADRTIDLDLVLYDDLVVEDATLILPHPDISRPFVHGPIVELLNEAAGEIPASLLAAIRGLLPESDDVVLSGEPLDALTAQLREMIA